MQLNITGHQVDLTDSLKQYVTSKFNKLERHFDQISNTQVTLSIQKQRHKAEASMHLSGAEVHAYSEHDDMYAAIDALLDKLDRQILKHKEKNVDRSHGAMSR